MRNASQESVIFGYEQIFRCNDGHTSREQINKDLVERGFDPISNKTFTYYRREYAAGCITWVPINVFNVKTEQGL